MIPYSKVYSIIVPLFFFWKKSFKKIIQYNTLKYLRFTGHEAWNWLPNDLGKNSIYVYRERAWKVKQEWTISESG